MNLKVSNRSGIPACMFLKSMTAGSFSAEDLLIFSMFYFLMSRDFPVISSGCSIPISSMSVGAISARQPPSLNP